MPSSAVLGYNIDFSIYNGSTYTQVAEVTDITWPGYVRDAVEVTYMDSADQFREYIAGLMDGGEMTIEMNWVPSATDVIIAALTASTTGQFKITYNNGVNLVVKAIVTGYQPQSPLGEKLSASATFKISGKPTWAAS
jgi:hypothetical protein